MTFQTGTNAEVLYCMPAAGATLNNSSANTIISGNTSTNPAYQLPPIQNLFGGPSYAAGRALRVVARGPCGTTGTPTLKIVCVLNTTQGTAAGAITLAGTGAFTTQSAITNGIWELEFGMDINSIGDTAGTAALSLDALGKLTIGDGNNAATRAGVSLMCGSSTAITTINPFTAYWIELAALWGTANASNTITCAQFEVLGLN